MKNNYENNSYSLVREVGFNEAGKHVGTEYRAYRVYPSGTKKLVHDDEFNYVIQKYL